MTRIETMTASRQLPLEAYRPAFSSLIIEGKPGVRAANVDARLDAAARVIRSALSG